MPVSTLWMPGRRCGGHTMISSDTSRFLLPAVGLTICSTHADRLQHLSSSATSYPAVCILLKLRAQQAVLTALYTWLADVRVALPVLQ